MCSAGRLRGGPIVDGGQDLELLVRLYAVPARDGAKPLVDTLPQLSGAVPGLAQVDAVAGVLKSGLEGLLGIQDTDSGSSEVRGAIVGIGMSAIGHSVV
jgi:hypothetical protein